MLCPICYGNPSFCRGVKRLLVGMEKSLFLILAVSMADETKSKSKDKHEH